MVPAQEQVKDSLLTLLSKAKEDTLRVNLLYDLSNYYHEEQVTKKMKIKSPSMPEKALVLLSR